jgi:hypothetical protein
MSGSLALALLVSLALILGPASAATKLHRHYVGGIPFSGRQLGGLLPQGKFGGTWTLIPQSARTMSVVVTDDYARAVGADVRFVIGSYEPLVERPPFCSTSPSFRIPSGAQAVYVRVLDDASLRCKPRGLPTTGSIDITFDP